MDRPIQGNDVTASFRATLRLVALVCKHQQAIEILAGYTPFINYIAEVIPHENADGSQDYISCCCVILRYLTRNESTYIKVCQRHPHIGDVLGTRLARPSNSLDVLIEGSSAFRNFCRKPEFAGKLDVIVVDYVVQAVKNTRAFEDEQHQEVRNVLG